MYLLDTNALIILLYGDVADGKLSEKSMEIMRTTDKLFVCAVSLWEISIKVKIGKLSIKTSMETIEKLCHENGIEIVPLKVSHMDKSLALPLIADHRDPFDRIILSSALYEGLTLISTDARMRNPEYGVEVLY